MKLLLTFAVAVTLATRLTNAPTFAIAQALPTEDSSAFENAYEGDDPSSGFGTSGYSADVSNYTLSSDGNILDVNGIQPSVGVFFLTNDTWDTDVTSATGWTWESRFKVIAVKKTTAFNLRIGDSENSADHPQDIFAFGLNSITNLSSPALNIPINLTDGFHTFRVAQAANSTVFNVWVDTDLVASYSLTTGFSGGDNQWYGDGSSTQDGHWQIDYIRWTADGAFAPTPAHLSGDLNLDGHVDSADIAVMESALSNISQYESTYDIQSSDLLSIMDINHDGQINNADLQALLSLLSSGGGSQTSVPEPASLILLAFAATCLWLKTASTKRLRTLSPMLGPADYAHS